MPPTRSSAIVGQRLATVALHVARWVERTLAEQDPPLPVAQFLALDALVRGAGAPGELARDAGVSGPAVSQLLRDMEDRGLVARRLSAADRRRHELGPTPRGREVHAAASARIAERVGALLAPLPEPDQRRLAELLEDVVSAVLGAPPPRRPRPPRPPGR